MEEKIDNSTYSEKLLKFFAENKLKILIVLSSIFIIIFILTLISFNEKNKNLLISEKYIEAGLHLRKGEEEKAKLLYEEIVLSKNKFYSTLAFNVILEKNLISNDNKIKDYFSLLEKVNFSNDQTDLLMFKKGLYLLKISKIEEGNILLKNLIDSNSNYKTLAQEILKK